MRNPQVFAALGGGNQSEADIMVKIFAGAMVAGLVMAALSSPALAQSAYERYPDQRYNQTYPDQRYDQGYNQTYPNQPPPNTYRDYPDPQYGSRYASQPTPSNAALDQAYREGYRAGWWANRRNQRYDDRRYDTSDYRYRR